MSEIGERFEGHLQLNEFYSRIEALEAQLAAVTAERDGLKHDAERHLAIVYEVEAERDVLVEALEALRVATLNAVQSMPGGQKKAELRDAHDAAVDTLAALAAVEESHE